MSINNGLELLPLQPCPDGSSQSSNYDRGLLLDRGLAFADAADLDPTISNLVRYGLTQHHLGQRDSGDTTLWEAFRLADKNGRLTEYNDAVRGETEHWLSLDELALAWNSLYRAVPGESSNARRAYTAYLAACIARRDDYRSVELMYRRRANELWLAAKTAGEKFNPKSAIINAAHLESQRLQPFLSGTYHQVEISLPVTPEVFAFGADMATVRPWQAPWGAITGIL